MTGQQYPVPMRQSGSLDEFERFDVTPILGTEFRNVDVADWLIRPDSDRLLRDLSILSIYPPIPYKCPVCVLSRTDEPHQRAPQGANRPDRGPRGKPKENGLYVHPLWQIRQEPDPELQLLNPEGVIQIYGKTAKGDKKQSGITEWHTDISFENNPPDYSSLRLTDLPPGGGGDTLWASSYEVYDKLSIPYQKFFESLTATYSQEALNQVAASKGTTIFQGPRGSPSNTGSALSSVHPVVRTHPITGWKAVFALGVHCHHINDVTKPESDQILEKIIHLVALNPDLQVRFRWENPHDIAIWDNRAVYHAPIQNHVGKRRGWRVLSVGERPYFDPNSVSRAEYLSSLAGKEEPVSASIAESHKLANGNNGHVEAASSVAIE
ncbi:TfdA family taurine catabolism dioxygenase TauD [Penicillium macrosclerotiorum]|uniref:TfdA family taurine catabolism dioxygenase TauD n=1 Tax=Penicillium macrosclerotiorum TaxID=303699 RepID=UPI002546933E|nr:TfdA family taurine catabolism dioxygenase TauD [Penicillium macrosclerotiorum]KAJ5689017.1 TfdA family taurine catabolism dioxygenase TauD [Penicillium macrosclerotiorum]